MLKTTPIQAVKLTLAYATFRDDTLAANVVSLLNSLEDDIEQLISLANAEGYSDETQASVKEITERLLEILNPTQEEVKDAETSDEI